MVIGALATVRKLRGLSFLPFSQIPDLIGIREEQLFFTEKLRQESIFGSIVNRRDAFGVAFPQRKATRAFAGRSTPIPKML
jgi:hypothetical protein